jgi:hypothetical protein
MLPVMLTGILAFAFLCMGMYSLQSDIQMHTFESSLARLLAHDTSRSSLLMWYCDGVAIIQNVTHTNSDNMKNVALSGLWVWLPGRLNRCFVFSGQCCIEWARVPEPPDSHGQASMEPVPVSFKVKARNHSTRTARQNTSLTFRHLSWVYTVTSVIS